MTNNAMIEEAKSKMKLSTDSFRQAVAGVRTGVAHPGLVENLSIEVAEADKRSTMVKLRQLATIRVTNGNELRIEPWEASNILGIQKSISESQLGLSARVDAKGGQKVIMVAVPPLSGEYRQKLVHEVSAMAEKARVDVRNVRRAYHDVLSKIKGGVKKKDSSTDKVNMSEDEARRTLEALDKLTEQGIAEVNQIAQDKQNDIMKS